MLCVRPLLLPKVHPCVLSSSSKNVPPAGHVLRLVCSKIWDRKVMGLRSRAPKPTTKMSCVARPILQILEGNSDGSALLSSSSHKIPKARGAWLCLSWSSKIRLRATSWVCLSSFKRGRQGGNVRLLLFLKIQQAAPYGLALRSSLLLLVFTKIDMKAGACSVFPKTSKSQTHDRPRSFPEPRCRRELACAAPPVHKNTTREVMVCAPFLLPAKKTKRKLQHRRIQLSVYKS
jgi:hypothetical protein